MKKVFSVVSVVLHGSVVCCVMVAFAGDDKAETVNG